MFYSKLESMEIFGTIAGILVVFAFTPQAYKTIHTKRTKDLSLATYVMLFLASVCWVIYGFYKESPALYLANTVVGVLALLIVAIKIREDFLSGDARQRNQRRSK